MAKYQKLFRHGLQHLTGGEEMTKSLFNLGWIDLKGYVQGCRCNIMKIISFRYISC